MTEEGTGQEGGNMNEDLNSIKRHRREIRRCSSTCRRGGEGPGAGRPVDAGGRREPHLFENYS